jgi:hypothetical protein
MATERSTFEEIGPITIKADKVNENRHEGRRDTKDGRRLCQQLQRGTMVLGRGSLMNGETSLYDISLLPIL